MNSAGLFHSQDSRKFLLCSFDPLSLHLNRHPSRNTDLRFFAQSQSTPRGRNLQIMSQGYSLLHKSLLFRVKTIHKIAMNAPITIEERKKDAIDQWQWHSYVFGIFSNSLISYFEYAKFKND